MDESRLVTMANTMTHRGPDDLGTYVSPDRRIGLGFRRLSIVDLAGGHQPMSNESCPGKRGGGRTDGLSAAADVHVMLNGEIYNHRDLRRELEALGHVYRSRCDAEALVHGYEEWGDGVVERLRGMFAFAVYDHGRRRLFLARDRLGVKPLYYRNAGGIFLFASEIKAILAWPGVEKAVDDEALYHYLTLMVTPAPSTMFRDIRKMPPGHTMSVDSDGRTVLRQYWDALPPEGLQTASEGEIVERLREMLRKSIELRMMSDVPFGVFLSGGLDSSLNVALMSELMDRPVDTFSVAISDDPLSDERSQARQVAAEFGADYHEVSVTPEQFVETMPHVVHHLDEPLADPVCVPLYHVSKLARENGTIVIQVGEGADELFAGYTGYGVMADFHRRMYAPFAALPGWLKRPVAMIAPSIMPERRAEYVRRAAAGEELFWGGAVAFPEQAKRRLLRNGVNGGSSDTYADVIAGHYSSIDGVRPRSAFLDRVIYLELKQRLPEFLLMRVDKMSMAASVEARVPYLDHELVQFALGISSSLKYRAGRAKHVLKEAARGILPDHVIDRPKTGFCGGARNMVSGPVLDYAERAMADSEWLREMVNFEVVENMVAEHRAGGRDNAAGIWSLLSVALWHRHWFERKPVLD